MHVLNSSQVKLEMLAWFHLFYLNRYKFTKRTWISSFNARILLFKEKIKTVIYLRLLNDQKRSSWWRVYDGSRWCRDFVNDSTCVHSRHDSVLTELLTGWIHYGSDTDDRRRPFILLNARSVWDVCCEWMQTAVLWRYNCLFWKMRD